VRPVRILVIAAGLVLGSLLVTPVSPASAHAGVESSTPENGASLTEPPSEISITFDEQVTEPGLTASDDTGTGVALGEVTVTGNTVSASWPSSAPAGIYTVEWTVVSDDGDPLTGTLLFSYGDASPSASPSASTSESATPTGDASSTAASGSSAPASTPSTTAVGSGTSESSTSALPWILGALGLGVVGGLVALARRTGASRPPVGPGRESD
jgi:copper resistance protein C